MNIKKGIVSALTAFFMVSSALFAAQEETQSTSTNEEDHNVVIASEEGMPDYVELIKEALKEDETCAPYVEVIRITLQDHLITLAGEVESEAIRFRIEEVVRNTTYFEVSNELTIAAGSDEDSTEEAKNQDEPEQDTGESD